MNQEFKVGKTIYVIILLVFVFGVFLETVRSDYLLSFKNYSKSTSTQENTNSEQSVPLQSEIEGHEESYLIVYDQGDTWSADLKNNIADTLRHLKKTNKTLPYAQLNIDLNSYSGVILTSENINKIPNVQEIASYVEGGGSVFFAVRPIPSDALYTLYRKMGIFEVGPLINTKGIKMRSNLLFNQKGLTINDTFLTNSSLAVRLYEEVNVHATSFNGTPLLWERKFGDGNFVMFNGTMLQEKINRGLLIGAIGALQEDFIYPIKNMQLTYISSFPAPLPNKGRSPLYDEFYRDTWWPYMKEQSRQFHLSLTSGLLVSFDEKIKSEAFTILEHDKRDVIKYGRELLNSGGELALTGYNPLPLTHGTDLQGLARKVDTFVQEILPSYTITSYMPDEGSLNQELTEKFTDEFSSIETIIPSYLEYDFQIKNGVAYLPWVTSGYLYTDEVKWKAVNNLIASGIFSHQISPWNQQLVNWEVYSKGFTHLLQDIREQYPWLNSVTASEGSRLLKKWEQTEVKVVYNDHSIQIHQSQSYPTSYILKTKRSVITSIGCSIDRIDEGVYLIQTNKEVCKLEVNE